MAKLIKINTQYIALTLCVELWSWLAKNPEARKSDWPRWEEIEAMTGYSHCPCCAYKNNPINYKRKRYCSQDCLISWGSQDGHCESKGSPYDEWREANLHIDNSTKIAHAAKKIVALANQALAKLPKPRTKK